MLEHNSKKNCGCLCCNQNRYIVARHIMQPEMEPPHFTLPSTYLLLHSFIVLKTLPWPLYQLLLMLYIHKFMLEYVPPLYFMALFKFIHNHWKQFPHATQNPQALLTLLKGHTWFKIYHSSTCYYRRWPICSLTTSPLLHSSDHFHYTFIGLLCTYTRNTHPLCNIILFPVNHANKKLI